MSDNSASSSGWSSNRLVEGVRTSRPTSARLFDPLRNPLSIGGGGRPRTRISEVELKALTQVYEDRLICVSTDHDRLATYMWLWTDDYFRVWSGLCTECCAEHRNFCESNLFMVAPYGYEVRSWPPPLPFRSPDA